jgi:phosphoserine phosphatase RsbU/P
VEARVKKRTVQDSLSEYIGMPLREIRDEFLLVAELQRRILPDPERLTVFGNYDVFGSTVPIAVVGGDFYDFIDLSGRFGLTGKMGIVIADAAGHGLVAAMLIRDFNTALYTAISFQAHYEKDTTPLLFPKINRRVYRSSQPHQFISAFYGELHLDGVIRYINAGHYDPLLFRKEEIIKLSTGGPVLGAFRDSPTGYQVGQEQLEPGDLLICYTDGIIEACDEQGQEYGVERLLELVRRNRGRSSREIFETINADVEKFSEAKGQTDDRTFIVIKRPDDEPCRPVDEVDSMEGTD